MSSRRDVILVLGAAALSSTRVIDFASAKGGSKTNALRVRTITAGVELSAALELDRVEKALAFLVRSKDAFTAAGYEVQTTRVAINPVIAGMDAQAREQSMKRLEAIDRAVVAHGAIFNVGPILTANRADDGLVAWSRELVRATRSISFSTVIASPDGGVQANVAETTAKIMVALCRALPDGLANFRFAAAANIPAGTPFFPVAWHQGVESFAIGMEAASVVEDAFASMPAGTDPTDHLRAALNEAFSPVEQLAQEIAQRERRQYLGIDTSPAPAKDRSIGAAIEALTRRPFGESGTLEACSTITAALKSVAVRTCGYSGLMLPVLEDQRLARRAGEHRYSIRDLLLFSSVCGTGLDVVPIAGDTSAETIAALLRDVAALATRLRKPLSARLFLVPDKKPGELARFTDPLLTDSVVMKVD